MVFAEVRTSPALSFSRRALDTLFGLRVSSRTKAAISGVRLLTSSLVVVVMVVVVVVVLSVVVVKVTLGPVDAEGCGELRVEVRDRVTVAVAVWVWVRVRISVWVGGTFVVIKAGVTVSSAGLQDWLSDAVTVIVCFTVVVITSCTGDGVTVTKAVRTSAAVVT